MQIFQVNNQVLSQPKLNKSQISITKIEIERFINFYLK
jgi:hypothetical protein